jgi:hypothetical protein
MPLPLLTDSKLANLFQSTLYYRAAAKCYLPEKLLSTLQAGFNRWTQKKDFELTG